MSVGGGSIKENISVNLINAIKLAKKTNSITISITANKKGYSFQNTDLFLVIRDSFAGGGRFVMVYKAVGGA